MINGPVSSEYFVIHPARVTERSGDTSQHISHLSDAVKYLGKYYPARLSIRWNVPFFMHHDLYAMSSNLAPVNDVRPQRSYFNP